MKFRSDFRREFDRAREQVGSYLVFAISGVEERVAANPVHVAESGTGVPGIT
ncbi:MAG: hypothetical protein ABR568_17380 [Pyrinomonadaceae bacterium]